MRQLDCHGRKINYDAPGQLGAGTPKPEKAPRVDPFLRGLDGLVAHHNRNGNREMPLHVTLAQMKRICGIPLEDMNWKPCGAEEYRGHPLVLAEE